MTIDQLATRTGVTSRTIREYQSVGVLAPPTKVGRVGQYDDTHLRRLTAIAQLQARGYSLAGIRDLFDAWESGRSLTAVLGVDDAAASSSVDERAAVFDAEQLEGFIPGIVRRRKLRDHAVRAGLIEPLDDRWLVCSPSLLQLVADTVAMGVKAERALDVAASMTDASARVAASAAELFVNEVWSPRAANGDGTDLEQIAAYVRRSRGMLQRAAASSLIRAVERAYEGADVPMADEFRALLAQVRVGAFDDRTHDETRTA
jgi:DNA-binding transcriptional MerR regulator